MADFGFESGSGSDSEYEPDEPETVPLAIASS